MIWYISYVLTFDFFVWLLLVLLSAASSCFLHLDFFVFSFHSFIHSFIASFYFSTFLLFYFSIFFLFFRWSLQFILQQTARVHIHTKTYKVHSIISFAKSPRRNTIQFCVKRNQNIINFNWMWLINRLGEIQFNQSNSSSAKN